MQNDWMKGTIFVGAKKVIPTKQRERKKGARPGIHQKQYKVLEIASTNTIVHPGTVVIHATNATIANTTVMRVCGFERLALSTHAVGVTEYALTFTGNGLDGDTARVRQGRLGVTRQGHHAQTRVNHAEDNGNPFRDGEKCNGKGRVYHE